LGTPATVVLRIIVLKHLSDWSFDECERAVGGSLVYRACCRIDGERVPDAKTLIRLARLLDEPVLKDLSDRLVTLGRERRMVRGRRLRVDTTVVETNIHYPTDATLLADGVRVLTRGMQRLGERVRERARSVARRVFEIAQRSRTAGQRALAAVRVRRQAKMKRLYQGLLRITRAVVGQADDIIARGRARRPTCPRPSNSCGACWRKPGRACFTVIRTIPTRSSASSSRTPTSSAKASSPSRRSSAGW
jgi:transposase, IS5 family